MDVDFILGLFSRWFHILAAIAAVGGTIFARFVVIPSLETLPPAEREELHAKMRARWSKIVAAAIAFLLISGLYNYITTVKTYEMPKWYHMWFGIKFLLAMIIFALASLLSGKTAAAQKLRQNAKMWMNLNIILAVLVVCISGVLRTALHVPKTVKTLEEAPAFHPGEPSLPVIEPGTAN
jgi:uncharacterized membrane protein